MWLRGRSTTQLTSVQLSDSRHEVVKAFSGIAELRAEDPVDVRRQQMLTGSMTTIIGTLNAASASVRGIGAEPPVARTRDDLFAAAMQLENEYR
jgi:hypothetical protein